MNSAAKVVAARLVMLEGAGILVRVLQPLQVREDFEVAQRMAGIWGGMPWTSQYLPSS